MPTSILTVCDHCGTALDPSIAGPCGHCGRWARRYVASVADRPPLRLLPAWVRRRPGPGHRYPA